MPSKCSTVLASDLLHKLFCHIRYINQIATSIKIKTYMFDEIEAMIHTKFDSCTI